MKKESDAMEILRMARELVINEHTDKRAQMHNEWVAQSEFLWKTKKQKLAYPPIPPYPTEAEILIRAKALMGFLKNDEGVADILVKNETTAPTIQAQLINTVEPQNGLSTATLAIEVSPQKKNEIVEAVVVEKQVEQIPKNVASPLTQIGAPPLAIQNEQTSTFKIEDIQEYGEWLPKLITSSNGGAIQVKNNFSDYVKVGKIIYLNFDISIESLGTGSDTSYVLLDNLPYISRDGGNYCGPLVVSYSEDMKVSVSSITGSVISGSYSCDMWIKKASELNLVRLQKGDLKNKTRLVGTVNYLAK
jgi:hypothetical protein